MMAAGRRRRCLLILQSLAAESERRRHAVTDERVAVDTPDNPRIHVHGRHYPSRYSRRENEIRIGISEFSYTVSIAEQSANRRLRKVEKADY